MRDSVTGGMLPSVLAIAGARSIVISASRCAGGHRAHRPNNRNETSVSEILDHHFNQAWQTLTAPGAPFELRHVHAYGRDVLAYVNAPADLREIWESSAQWGDRDYIIFQEERLSYAQAHRITASVRAWFARQGIVQGDHVAIAMRNYPEWMLIYWACVSAGIVVAGFNAWWTTSEMRLALDECAVKAIFCDSERLERLPPLAELRCRPAVVAVRAAVPDGGFAWDDVAATTGPAPTLPIGLEDDACILFTSGTTGAPKGAQLTHLSCVTSFMNQRFSGEVHGLAAQLAFGPEATANAPNIPVALATTPLFHVTANNTLAHPITYDGGKLILMRKWDVDEALRIAAAEHVTHLNGVPLIVREFVSNIDRAGGPLPALFLLGAGGAPFGPDLVDKIHHLDGAVIAAAGYGMTEVTGSISINIREFLGERPMSSGRPLPSYETRLVDAHRDSSGRLVGELCVKGGSVIKGYLNRPDATAEAIVDGWLHTGDIAHFDDQGYLFIVDRKKDMVLRGGENVYCVEVEAALYRHPAVAEACVFGVDDERLGEEVGAAVMCRPGSSVDVETLRTVAAEYLAAYKVPRFIWLLDTPLPRNASGKIMRRELRETLTRETALPGG